MMRRVSIFLMVVLVACGSSNEDQKPAKKTDPADFEVITTGKVIDLQPYIQKDVITIFDFYADWCPPCKKLDRSLAALQDTYGSKMKVYKLDLVDWKSELAAHHQIRDLPYLIVYDKGGNEVQNGPSNKVMPNLVKLLNSP